MFGNLHSMIGFPEELLVLHDDIFILKSFIIDKQVLRLTYKTYNIHCTKNKIKLLPIL